MKSIKYVGIDFDGTIATEGSFPDVGELIPHAPNVINKLKNRGFVIVIWTCREGEVAEKAKEFLNTNGISYDYFNENPCDLIAKYGNNCRKVGVDVFIDDKNIGCNGIDWLEIERHTDECWIVKEG